MALPAVSPAETRMRRSAARLLRRFGFRARFIRIEVTYPDFSGEPIETRTAIVDAWCSREMRSAARRLEDGENRDLALETVLLIEQGPFEEYGGLSDEWICVIGSAEIELLNVVTSEDFTYWEARVEIPLDTGPEDLLMLPNAAKRYSVPGHGFAIGRQAVPVRLEAVGEVWTASIADDFANLATHILFNVPSPDWLDVATAGTVDHVAHGLADPGEEGYLSRTVEGEIDYVAPGLGEISQRLIQITSLDAYLVLLDPGILL